MPVIKVNIENKPYAVVVGSGVIKKLPSQLKLHVKNRRLFIFYDANFYALHRMNILASVAHAAEVIEMVLPPGERTKSMAQYRKVIDFLLSEKIDRSDFILACGGGVVSDLIGFAASTLYRGISWGIVSTTLMGMVDAAIGGKTGLNLPYGKNLLGSFYQPSFVLCDIDFLGTLPMRHMVSGCGELVKYAGLMGPEMFQAVKNYVENGDLYNRDNLLGIISPAIKYKAKIVVEDTYDKDRRRFLNFGHTFAHAFEKAGQYKKFYHGEAVILGMYSALLAGKDYYGKSTQKLIEYEKIIASLIRMLPGRSVSSKEVTEAMQFDKKRKNARLNFVLLRDLGKPVIIDSLDQRIILKALKETMERYQELGGKHDANSGR